MKWKFGVTTLVFAGCASAFWRMECRGRVGLARIDPLVNPSEVSTHLHAIHGSSGFSEVATYEDLVNANCTSCAVTQDKSAYWTPAVYFKHRNGSFELVPQIGGMLAYYFLNPTPGAKGNITAFPKGFRMIAGDSIRRNYVITSEKGDITDATLVDAPKSNWAMLKEDDQQDLRQRAIGFNCLNYHKEPEGSLYRHYLPEKSYLDANCADGIRIELMFPSCWNGKDLDSADHKSHVAYPDLVINGNCPQDFPVRLPGLFFETIWATNTFTGVDGEFVLSNGDIKGFGYHGDFIMGWDEKLLQKAVDTCTNDSGKIQDCPLFDILSEYEQNQCKLNLPANLAKEVVEGIVGDTLPGKVAIQYGPGPATDHDPPRTPTDSVAIPTATYSPGVYAANSASVSIGQVFKDLSSSSSSSVPTPTPTMTPAVTPPPASAPTDLPKTLYVSTEYVTVEHAVKEIVHENVIVYVTETVPPAVKARVMPRHVHRRRAHHGGHF